MTIQNSGTRGQFSKKIRETNMFSRLNPIAQKIALSRNNVSHLYNGYMVAKNRGFDHFEKTSGFNSRNQQIIKEIIENES